jgi:hypothetical protein
VTKRALRQRESGCPTSVFVVDSSVCAHKKITHNNSNDDGDRSDYGSRANVVPLVSSMAQNSEFSKDLG